MNNEITFLDLFAGAGGLSEGFITAGFTPLAHVEIDEAACYTLKTRMAYHWLKNNNRLHDYSDYLCGKITREQLYKIVPQENISSVINAEINEHTLTTIFSRIDAMRKKRPIDLIIGGPPCQGYSLVGRSRDKNRMRGDKRNFLYLYYCEFLKKYKPKYFVFENVTGLLSARSEDGSLYFDNMRKMFKRAGYETEFKPLLSNNYGVLQNRKRIILVGKRGNDTGFYPEPEQWHPKVTVNEVLKDMPSLQSGEGNGKPCKLKKYTGQYLYDAGLRNEKTPVTLHQARPHNKQDLEIYRIAVEKWNRSQQRLDYNDLPNRLKTHKNRSSFLDRFKVVAGDMPYSHTVVAHIAKDGHYYIHPSVEQNRSITPREAARLQSFPDDFFFEGASTSHSRTSAFKQIGNAVPVLMANKIAEVLQEAW